MSSLAPPTAGLTGGTGGPQPAVAGRLGRRRLRLGPLGLIGRRLLAAIPVVWGVTFLSFAILNMLPGDAAQALLGADATPDQVAQFRHELHLDRPFLARYWSWLGDAVTGHLGRSLGSGEPVTTILKSRLPITFELMLLAFLISLVIAVPLGALAARRPDGVVDRISLGASMIGLSIAPYVLALGLILVFADKLSWFPALGWQPLSSGLGANLRTVFLPALALGLPLGCLYLRLFRADIVEQIEGEEYVVTAHAKGLGGWRVLLRHAMPNSLFGLITVVALNVGTLLGGTVLVEQIYGLPGIGQELFQAIQTRDIPVLEGIVAVFAVVVVIVGLLADLLYAVLDPRVRYARADG
jgi:peptide/nickel transport system permease protein